MLCFHQCCRWEARACSVIVLPWDTFLAVLALDSPGWSEQSGVTSGSCRSEKYQGDEKGSQQSIENRAGLLLLRIKCITHNRQRGATNIRWKCKITNAETINLFGSASKEFHPHQASPSSCKLQAERLSCNSHFRGECINTACKKHPLFLSRKKWKLISKYRIPKLSFSWSNNSN